MKRNKRPNKYTKLTTETSEPICPICGEHTIKTEIEPVEYKIDDDIFTMNEMFFRCYKNPGEQYATAEMVKHNTNALRSYLLKKEHNKKPLSVSDFRDTDNKVIDLVFDRLVLQDAMKKSHKNTPYNGSNP